MNRTCPCFLAFVWLLASVPVGSGADTKKPRTDRHGDPLPPGVVDRLGPVRLRHANAEVAFSRDGKQLISCDRQGEIRIWDVAAGKQVGEKKLGWPMEMTVVALSPDGATLAACDGDTVELRDTSTGKERGRIPALHLVRPNLIVLAFSADSKFLAVQAAGEGENFRMQLWDVATVKKCRTFQTPRGNAVANLTFSRDGKRLAGIALREDGSGKLGGVVADLLLWDTATAKLLAKREDLRQIDAETLAFAPDGKTLTAGRHNEGGVRLFDAATLQAPNDRKAKLEVPGSLDRLVYSPDGRWLAAVSTIGGIGMNRTYDLLLWDLRTEKEARRWSCREGTRIVFAPDGRTLASHDSEGSAIRLRDVASGKPLHQQPGHDEPVLELGLSPDGKILASGDAGGTVQLWDTVSGEPLRHLDARPLNITKCRFSADGQRVLAAGVIVSTQYHVFDSHAGFQIWDVASGKSLGRIEKKGAAPLYAATLCADGTRVAAVVAVEGGSEARLIIWDVVTGKPISERPYKCEVRAADKGKGEKYAEMIVHAAFTPEGEQMTEWRGDRMGIEEVATGCLRAELPRDVGLPLAFSPDGRLMAASRWKPRKGPRQHGDLLGLSILETASGQEIVRLERGGDLPESGAFDRAAFSRDGRRLVVTDHDHLTVWDIETGRKLSRRQAPGSSAAPSDLDVPYSSPLVMLPHARLATGMADGAVLIWDLKTEMRATSSSAQELDGKTLAALWSDLAGDAGKAHRAISLLAASPAQTLPLLKEHLRPAEVNTPAMEQLLADLDSDSFAVREAAVRELTRLHYRIEPLLRRAVEKKPTLEVRRRLESILAGPKRLLPDDLRTLRALTVLERIGTPEARRIVDRLAGGAVSPESRAAQAALQRLKLRDTGAQEKSSP